MNGDVKKGNSEWAAALATVSNALLSRAANVSIVVEGVRWWLGSELKDGYDIIGPTSAS